MKKTEADLQSLINQCNAMYGANNWTLQYQQQGFSVRDKDFENIFGFGSKTELYYCIIAYIKGYVAARDLYEQAFVPTEEDLKEYKGY